MRPMTGMEALLRISDALADAVLEMSDDEIAELATQADGDRVAQIVASATLADERARQAQAFARARSLSAKAAHAPRLGAPYRLNLGNAVAGADAGRAGDARLTVKRRPPGPKKDG